MLEKELTDVLLKNKIFNVSNKDIFNAYICPSSLQLKNYPQNHIIVSPENSKKSIGIIFSGTALVAPVSSSDNTMIKLLVENDMFGISNMFSDTNSFPSIITAKTNVTVLFIDETAFKNFLYADLSAMTEYLKLLSEKIVYLNKKISTLTAGSTEKKLAFFLCENERDGKFISTISMSSLANMLNVGRASLYRAFETLTNEKLIIKNGKSIIIPDKNALLKYI